MSDYLTAMAAICGPGLIAAMLLAGLAQVPACRVRARWLQLSVAAICAAALAAFGIAATDLIQSTTTGLLRDALASGALSGAITVLMAVAVGQALWRGASALRGALLGMLLAALLSGFAPILVLLVHCTSGDCL